MVYTFDIVKIIRRYMPVKLRHDFNVELVYVFCSWVKRIHDDFLAWRTDRILPEYRYNGLIHSLEWACNDRFDPLNREIYITVVDQVPLYYFEDDAEPATVHYEDEGQSSGYYHTDEAEGANYDYEFIVHVPNTLTFSTDEMFDLLDLYRYAGRRPAIQLMDGLTVVETILYPGLEPPANYLTPLDSNNLPSV